MTSIGSRPGRLVTGKSHVADWPMPGQDASSVSLLSTKLGMTMPDSALIVRVTMSRNGIRRERSSVTQERPGTSKLSNPDRGARPNSVIDSMVTLAGSANGLKSWSSSVNPSAVTPPTSCHSFGTDTTQRSPVRSSSDHVAVVTTAGPSSNSTMPGDVPLLAISPVSMLRAPGPSSRSSAMSGSSAGFGFGRVMTALTSIIEAMANVESRNAPEPTHGQYQALGSPVAPPASGAMVPNAGGVVSTGAFCASAKAPMSATTTMAINRLIRISFPPTRTRSERGAMRRRASPGCDGIRSDRTRPTRRKR